MGDTKHTPGPLLVREDAGWPWKVRIVDGNGETVWSEPRACSTTQWKSLEDVHDLRGVHGAERGEWRHANDRQMADAYLRASAPDLYEALSEIVAHAPDMGTGRFLDGLVKARTALRAARGEIA